jgi:hypothetical protein
LHPGYVYAFVALKVGAQTAVPALKKRRHGIDIMAQII